MKSVILYSIGSNASANWEAPFTINSECVRVFSSLIKIRNETVCYACAEPQLRVLRRKPSWWAWYKLC